MQARQLAAENTKGRTRLRVSPKWRTARICLHWSGQPDSNRRHQPWQGCTLPTELCPQERRRLVEPTAAVKARKLRTLDPNSVGLELLVEVRAVDAEGVGGALHVAGKFAQTSE